ncbi:hypothetical protein FA95DRAFT_1552554 [Auriscalpium vulgare]|uniref:Uncharacterized protein n=1 Tax=Auriscalpium vulgare TaxID=40419 RepID=A0ACB8SBZ8_9AGAM|nr:hypothetical protein FA95DRAFT_1552554 [Auriscalpium vulgare]
MASTRLKRGPSPEFVVNSRFLAPHFHSPHCTLAASCLTPSMDSFTNVSDMSSWDAMLTPDGGDVCVPIDQEHYGSSTTTAMCTIS